MPKTAPPDPADDHALRPAARYVDPRPTVRPVRPRVLPLRPPPGASKSDAAMYFIGSPLVVGPPVSHLSVREAGASAYPLPIAYLWSCLGVAWGSEVPGIGYMRTSENPLKAKFASPRSEGACQQGGSIPSRGITGRIARGWSPGCVEHRTGPQRGAKGTRPRTPYGTSGRRSIPQRGDLFLQADFREPLEANFGEHPFRLLR
jgi:hypothetical protein